MNVQVKGGPPGLSTAMLQPNKIIINVGGTRFETYKSTLRNIPDTRLAWVTDSKADNPDYDDITGEYFFDRHPSMFLMILNYYRTGKLHTPNDVCGPAFEEELLFWGIDEKQVESCCWGSYCEHRDAQQTLEELRIDTTVDGDEYDTMFVPFGSTAGKFGITESEAYKRSLWQKVKPKIWAVVNHQSASLAAKTFTGISLILTIAVITTFILETHSCCRILRNESDPVVVETSFIDYRNQTKPHPILYYIEIVCMVELTAEVFLRLITSPVKKMFFKNPMNIIDLVSLLSFYIMSALFLVDESFMDRRLTLPLQLLRLVRVFRIFKVATHLPALKILFHTLKASAMELLLMLILIISLIVCFASAIYYVEQIEEVPQNHFTSIPIGFWWAIVTMTTLGYGDKYPQTAAGYLIGSICAICGVLFIALPIPIIVNNFSTYYTHAKAQEKLPKKKKVALVGAADALKQRGDEFTHDARDLNNSNCSSREASPTQRLTEDPSNKGVRKASIVNESLDSERHTGGISVTFTDIDEIEEIKETNGTVICNGHVSNTPPEKPANNMGYIAEEETETGEISPAGSRMRQTSLTTQARSRRASLLPGGVSNTATQDGTNEKGDSLGKNYIPVQKLTQCRLSQNIPTYQTNSDVDSPSQLRWRSSGGSFPRDYATVPKPPPKVAGARERRQSLMPATYTGGR